MSKFDSIEDLEYNYPDGRRDDDWMKSFYEKYSKNHYEFQLFLPGFKLTSKKTSEILTLPTKHLSRVYKSETGDIFALRYRVKTVWSALIAYIYETPRYYVMVVSGKRMRAPDHVMTYGNSDMFAMKLFETIKEPKKDWKERFKKFERCLDLLDLNDSRLTPFLWFGKGMCSPDYETKFLNFYRCIEILAKERFKKEREMIKTSFQNAFSGTFTKDEVKRLSKEWRIPPIFAIPKFLEENGCSKNLIESWKEYRDGIAHGDYSFSLDEVFIHKVSELMKITKTILDKKVTELFKNTKTKGSM